MSRKLGCEAHRIVSSSPMTRPLHVFEGGCCDLDHAGGCTRTRELTTIKQHHIDPDSPGFLSFCSHLGYHEIMR